MSLGSLIVATLLYAVVVTSLVMAMRTWTIRAQRVREVFAAWIVFAASVFVLTALLVRIALPSQFVAAWTARIAKRPFVVATPSLSEMLVVAVLFVVFYRAAARLYERWDGLRSVRHQRRVERSEPSSMLGDGLSTIGRFLVRRPPLEVHASTAWRRSVPVLETVRESSTWREEARELIKLRSASYEPETWHDAEGCWVGQNADNAKPLLLFPTHEPPSEEDVARFIAYAMELYPAHKEAEVAIFIAIEEGSGASVATHDRSVQVFTREQLLHDLLGTFSDYRRSILRRVQTQTLPDSNLTLPDVYVPSQFAMNGRRIDAETYLGEWLDDPTQRQMAMLGDYGQGKSTTTLLFTYHLLEREDWRDRRIPVLIELRGTSPRNLQPLSLLGAWAAPHGINPKAMLKLLIAGKILLIFEGFDEMALVGDAEMRLKHFRVLWEFCYERAKILITGRPNFFLDDTEMRMALGIHAPAVGRPYCEAVRLALFTTTQIEESLRAHPESVRIGVSELAKQNERFAELVSRPSLLHIVSVLWDRERLFEKVDRLDSAYVMELFVRHSYRRQGRKEKDSPDFMALTSVEREYFMKAIATFMAAKKLPNQISGAQLNQLIADLVEAAPAALSSFDAMTGETPQPLGERVRAREHGLEHVETDVRACGLLVADVAAPGMFRFGHKSFMEYLVAATMAERIAPDSDTSRTILRVTGGRVGDVVELPVAMEFLAEIVGREDLELVRASALVAERRHGIEIRLFHAVTNTRGSESFFARLALFDRAAALSTTGLRSLIVSVSILVVLPALALAAVAAPAIIAVAPNDDDRRIAALAVATLPFMFFYHLRLQAPRKYGNDFIVWNMLCARLQIPDEVLHRFAGSCWVPWARKQKFDFFLRPTPEPRARTRTGEAAPRSDRAASA